MADSADALIRSGAISGKQAGKHKLAVLKKTKVERDNEEQFDGKQGLRDQGAGKEKGHGVANVKHIDTPNQSVGRFKPTKGGAVGNPRGNAKSGEINDGGNQGPEFPRAGGSSKASKGGQAYEDGDEGPDEMDARPNQKPSFPKEGRGKETGNKRAKSKIAKQGGQYGGGSRNTQ